MIQLKKIEDFLNFVSELSIEEWEFFKNYIDSNIELIQKMNSLKNEYADIKCSFRKELFKTKISGIEPDNTNT